MRINKDNLHKVYRAKACSVETMELLGYELVEELFVDSSGFGRDDELALTVSSFERELLRLINEYGTLTAKITRAGQFQVYVGLFTKTGTKRAKTIASNCYLITDDDGTRRVRLYETDILTDNRDGTLTVDNGGFATRTTHKRIMEFSDLYANSKQWQTYINGTLLTDENNKFKGALTV